MVSTISRYIIINPFFLRGYLIAKIIA